MSRSRHLFTAALLAAPLLTLTAPAAAGPLSARADIVVVESPTVEAVAVFPAGAQDPTITSIARRRHLIVDSNGGTAQDPLSLKYAGAAGSSTDYQLWNLAQNRALTQEEAATLVLDFHFNLSGLTTTDGDCHERDVSVSMGLTGGNWARAAGDRGYRISCIGSTIMIGNQALLEPVVDADYTVRHDTAAGGTLTMGLSGLAAITSTVFHDLWLESVTLVQQAVVGDALLAAAAAGVWNIADGLGVALFDGNAIDMIVVVPPAAGPGVPLPASALLVALALGLALRPQRRLRASGARRAAAA